ncbi:MAG TPA: UDP-N-acetylmuramoyl-L-alanyl-D-glutamate--2,6-diaminopimelate ligase [bacterium]|nr:UDP-N-acetylmuramoyl-L-alanyl-D-glutamate--2,6-diaminopimelate ligase [bacterium]
MRWKALLQAIEPLRVEGSGDPVISGIAENSKLVKRGELFACIPGAKQDGRAFAAEAARKGAAALLVEKKAVPGLAVPQAVVGDAREALALASHAFYGHPSRSVKVVGVTGTKGKTTTTFLIRSILRQAGFKTGLMGTIAYEIGKKKIEANNTTPSSLTLAKLLFEMKKAGCAWAVMEVSSHALEMKRVLGLEFTGAAFTNLGRDHLDYHKTFANYFKAKSRLFTEFPTVKARAVNADDAYGRKLLKRLGSKGVGYGVGRKCAYQATQVELTPGHLRFAVQGRPFQVPLTGLFNVYNALAAIAVLRELGFPWRTLQKGLAQAPAVPGRFEQVQGGQPFTLLVDYAHTSDALEQALIASRQLIGDKDHRLISVFGCGGDRDKTKRPLMGEISSRLADLTVVTSDNPRTEDPKSILREIVKGIPAAAIQNGHRRVWVEEDRAKAIRLAISMARPGDVVLIAGKGHETYQVIGETKHHFDDREEALKALRRMGK